MTPKGNRPDVGVEAIKSSDENVPQTLPEFEPYSPEFNPFTFKLRPALRGNDLDPLYESRLLGFSEAWGARQDEVDRLNDEADRLWLRANNSPAEIRDIQQRQISGGYAAYVARFMAGEAV